MSKIRFEAKLSKIGAWTIIKLPKNVSNKLPSRGMVMINGSINNFEFQAPLEPDGKGSHWLKVEKNMMQRIKGDAITIEAEVMKVWPEPKVPADLKKALASTKTAQATWMDITPMLVGIGFVGLVQQKILKRARNALGWLYQKWMQEIADRVVLTAPNVLMFLYRTMGC